MTYDEARERIAVALKRVSIQRPMHRLSKEYRDAKGRVGGGPRRNYVLGLLSEAQNHRCAHCGTKLNLDASPHQNDIPNAASLEHIVPVKFGGPFHFLNMVAACWSCNDKRGSDITIEELAPMYPDIEWQHIEIGPDSNLPPLSFSGTSTYLPSVFRETGARDEIMATIPILYREMAEAEMPIAIEQLLSKEKLSRDDPRFMRLFGSMKSKRLKAELKIKLSGEQNHRCGHCGSGLDPYDNSENCKYGPHITPIIPHEYGGPSHEINYAVLCRKCHLGTFPNRVANLSRSLLHDRGELTNAEKRKAKYGKTKGLR